MIKKSHDISFSKSFPFSVLLASLDQFHSHLETLPTIINFN